MPAGTQIYTPYIPGISRLLPEAQFDKLVDKFGVRVKWMKAHSCPCVYGGDMPGSPDNKCTTCGGRGIYWDSPSALFNALVTLIHTAISPDEPGNITDPSFGAIFKEEPLLSIAYDDVPYIWTQASVYDAFVEWDAFTRYEATLEVGIREQLPYQQNATVDSTGAVTVYNAETKAAESTNDYAYSDGKVILSGYPDGTPYTVEFYASPVFIAYDRSGGFPHVRPFGQPSTNLLPRRFRLQLLDMWLRARGRGKSPNIIFAP